MLQSKGNHLCYVHLIYDVCEVNAGWLSRLLFMTTSKNLFQNSKEATEIYILLCYLIYLHIKPDCCNFRYIQLAYGGCKCESPTCPLFHPLSNLHIKLGCCNDRYIQLAYVGSKSPTFSPFHCP